MNLVDLYLSEPDKLAINAATKAAEEMTSGEIVVRVASRSKNWATTRLIIMASFALVFAGVAFAYTFSNSWGWYVNTFPVVVATGLGLAVGYACFKAIPWRRANRKGVVWRKAMDIFRSLPATKGGTGVLIFVSLQEQEAAIIGDRQIASKMPREYWDELHATLDRAMQQGNHAEGILLVIKDLGLKLRTHFPHQADDVNELPDGLETAD